MALGLFVFWELLHETGLPSILPSFWSYGIMLAHVDVFMLSLGGMRVVDGRTIGLAS